MLLKGIRRLDSLPSSKAPVTLDLLESCYMALNQTSPHDRMLWGVLCTSFFFLQRRSEIASSGKAFQWFALRDEDVAILDGQGNPTIRPDQSDKVAIRLRGSKANQHGSPTNRILARSGHPYICPVFGALCLKHFRGPAQPSTPIALFVTPDGQQHTVSAARIKFALQHAAHRLGLQSKDYTSHSLRAGGATQMYRRGISALTISSTDTGYRTRSRFTED